MLKRRPSLETAVMAPAWDVPAYPANHPVERAVSRLATSESIAADYLRTFPLSIYMEIPDVSRNQCAASTDKFKLFLGRGKVLFCHSPTRILRQLNRGAPASAFCQGHVVLELDGVIWDWTMRQFWPDAPWPLVIPRARLRKFWEVVEPY